jgi:hypothetical protein
VAKYFLAVELLESAASARLDTGARMAVAAALNLATATAGTMSSAVLVRELVTGFGRKQAASISCDQLAAGITVGSGTRN